MGTARIRKENQKNAKVRSGPRRTSPQRSTEVMSDQSRIPHPHRGSTLDEFLDADGTRAELDTVAIKEVIAWQVAQTMKRQKLSKAGMAERMGTSRAQLDRLLNPQRDVTLSTLARAAAALGRRLSVTMV
jgi:antitoxin HicB